MQRGSLALGQFPLTPFPMLSYKILESKISLWMAPMFQHWLGVENISKSRKFGTATMHQSIPAVPLPHSRPISGNEHLNKLGNSQGWGLKRAHPENNSNKFNKSSLFCMPEPVQKVSCYYSNKSLRSKLAHFPIVLHT